MKRVEVQAEGEFEAGAGSDARVYRSRRPRTGRGGTTQGKESGWTDGEGSADKLNGRTDRVLILSAHGSLWSWFLERIVFCFHR